MSIKINDHLNQYEFGCNLPSDGREIKFKPFTTGQMKKLLTYENTEDPFVVEEMLDDLIVNCVINEGFNLDELLLQDRFYLLLKIRAASKGDVYSFTYKCPKCDTETPDNIKISELPVKEMNIDTTPIPLTDTLSVKMKLITRGEQKQVQNLIGGARLTPQQKMVEAITTGVAVSMDTFITAEEEDSEVPLGEKVEFINLGLPTSGFELLKDWLEANDFGIVFEAPIHCMQCGHKETFNIPIDNFFD